MKFEIPFDLAVQDQQYDFTMSNQYEEYNFGTASAIHPILTRDYEELDNKPRIEGVELIGDKTYEELNLNRISNAEIEELFNNI